MIKYQSSSLNNLKEKFKMRFFGELSNKIIWAIVSVLLIAAGYVAVLNIWLKPKPIPISTSSNSPSTNTNTNPLPQSQVRPLDQDRGVSSTKIEKTQTSNDDFIPALAKGNEINLIKPKQLERGGILKIFRPFEVPLRNAPKEILPNTNTLLNREETQELNGLFFIPEDGLYNFKVYGINFQSISKDDRIRTFLRVDGAAIENFSNPIYLQKGWYDFTFQFLYFYKEPDFTNILVFYINFEELAFKWRKTQDKSFKEIELWRVVE